MSESKHKVEVKFSGTEFDHFFFLEGRRVALFPVEGEFYRELESFPVVGNLDIAMVAEGFPGTACTLLITVDEKIKKKYSTKVSEKGLAKIIRELKVS